MFRRTCAIPKAGGAQLRRARRRSRPRHCYVGEYWRPGAQSQGTGGEVAISYNGRTVAGQRRQSIPRARSRVWGGKTAPRADSLRVQGQRAVPQNGIAVGRDTGIARNAQNWDSRRVETVSPLKVTSESPSGLRILDIVQADRYWRHMDNGETVVAARCSDHAANVLVGARFDDAEGLYSRLPGAPYRDIAARPHARPAE